ncbi:hypothetical protein ATCVMN08101_337R [Acanthocystis turfacea Chlorella virus MN0810.1]|nr:hypothetical protein ATCVMN08101_337R [Acanthocystis turfacea Chlorella virus MN0810.1]
MAMATGISFGLILSLIDDALLDASKPLAIQAIVDFAEGKDGKLGTADDRLSPETLALLKQMIEDGTIDRLVEQMYTPKFWESVWGAIKSCFWCSG